MKFVLALICTFFILTSFGQNLDFNNRNFVNPDYFIELPEYSGQTEPLNPGQTEPVIPGQTEPLIPVKLSHLRV